MINKNKLSELKQIIKELRRSGLYVSYRVLYQKGEILITVAESEHLEPLKRLTVKENPEKQNEKTVVEAINELKQEFKGEI